MSEGKASLYSVIPASVRYDTRLRPNAKLLYGELSALTMSEGYCWASNTYLAQLFDLSTKTVEALIKQLRDCGHIVVEVQRDEQTNEVTARKIWISGPPGTSVPPPLKNKGRSPQNQGDPPLEIEGKNIYKLSNIPPIVPPEGDAPKPKRKRRGKSVPDHNPERFERFWAAYPRDENRARAVEEWDKLAADDALMDEIALGLKHALQSEDWRSGIGIPHAFRWLRDRRWTERGKKSVSVSAPEFRERTYHIEIIDGEEVVVYDQ